MVPFEKIGAVLGAAFDNDAITSASVDKDGSNRLSAPIPCHISYKTVDDPDEVTIIAESRVPLELYVQLNFSLEYKGILYNKDYLTIEKHDSEGNVIATMSGRIGAVTVRQSRCICLVDVFDGGATPTPPEPEPEPEPEEIQIRVSDGEGGYSWTYANSPLRLTFYTDKIVFDLTSVWIPREVSGNHYINYATPSTSALGTRVRNSLRFRKKSDPSTEYVFDFSKVVGSYSDYPEYDETTGEYYGAYKVYA